MTTLADVLVLGSPVLLTTDGPDGPRTRPVILQGDPWRERSTLAVLTAAHADKVEDVRRSPRVALAATTPDGFVAIQADTEIIEDPEVVQRAMARFLGTAPTEGAADDAADGGSSSSAEAAGSGGAATPGEGPGPENSGSASGAPATVLIRLRATSGHVWTVRSPAPFDNEVHDLEL